MYRLADYCTLATGWRRMVLAVAAGAFAALAMPPVGLFPVLVVSFAIAIWLLDGCVASRGSRTFPAASALRQAAWIGWLWGLGYHVAGLWWLGAAFLVDSDRFLWALPFGVLGLPAALAFFTALGFCLARMFWRPGPSRILWFAASLTIAEYLRGTILTGFPWNAIGMAVGDHLVIAQIASVVGLHGLTLMAAVLFALPTQIVDARDSSRRLNWFWPGVALAGFVAIGLFGWVRLNEATVQNVSGVRLRIMQPNIPQSAHFDAKSAMELVRSYLSLSDRATSPANNGLADVTHLVWPESPFPFPLAHEPRALEMIGNALGGHTALITGGVRVEPDGPGTFRAFNALFVLDRNGRIADTYDKVHLVPFGEYLPFSLLLKRLRLRQFVDVPNGFDAGQRRHPVIVPGLPPIQPLICYEAIFPGEVLPTDPPARPDVLVNITNDAWFGLTAGPYQHFAQARLRTIEEGLPMVRAANSGISAVVDPHGRVIARLGLGATGVLDSALPKPIAPTIFEKFGTWPAALLWIATVLCAILTSRGEAKKAHPYAPTGGR